jgi:hypothetical protein
MKPLPAGTYGGDSIRPSSGTEKHPCPAKAMPPCPRLTLLLLFLSTYIHIPTAIILRSLKHKRTPTKSRRWGANIDKPSRSHTRGVPAASQCITHESPDISTFNICSHPPEVLQRQHNFFDPPNNLDRRAKNIR